MIKFGSNDISVGYIKELLYSFNLPMIDVYKNQRLHPGSKYIKGDKIYNAKKSDISDDVVLDNTWALSYSYNAKIQNITNNFNNRSLNYDYNTHKYLGKYLRFLRDYKHIDLMNLYNYFSNEYVSNLDISFNNSSNELVTFNSNDSNYKYYLIPICFDRLYTLAIGCNLPYEMCCIFYSKNYYVLENKGIEGQTYQKINNSSFNKPILYDKLDKFTDKLNPSYFNEYYKLKDSLCLVLKLPVSCKSSIVILEGDHRADNDYAMKNGMMINNYSITNYECKDNNKLREITLSSKSQLLAFNSGISYPFADKLLGYLTDNTICNLTVISDDIKRIQKKLLELQERPKKVNNSDYVIIPNKNIASPYGIWEDKYRNILYDYHRRLMVNKYDSSFDILGYCDRDIEKDLEFFRKDGKDIKV